MVQVTLMDGSSLGIDREVILGVFPVTSLFRHPRLLQGALYCHHGKIIPIEGPLGSPGEPDTWLLLTASSGRVIRGFPRFDDDLAQSPSLHLAPPPPGANEEERLLQEMAELLKSA